jgi:hypothetical protein
VRKRSTFLIDFLIIFLGFSHLLVYNTKIMNKEHKESATAVIIRQLSEIQQSVCKCDKTIEKIWSDTAEIRATDNQKNKQSSN